MKQIAISGINIYQIIISSFLKQLLGVSRSCKFEETCSDFTKRSISEQGLFRGAFLGLSRLVKCQPFYKGES